MKVSKINVQQCEAGMAISLRIAPDGIAERELLKLFEEACTQMWCVPIMCDDNSLEISGVIRGPDRRVVPPIRKG